MNARFQPVVIALSGATMLVAALPASASDWVDVKSPEELRILHSNKTFRGKTYAGESSVSHYRADGKVLRVVGSVRQAREWQVEASGQVCYSGEGIQRQCFRIQRNLKNPSEIMLHSVPGPGGTGFAASGFVTVEDGIPQF